MFKHVVDENGVGSDVEMTPEEEAAFLESLIPPPPPPVTNVDVNVERQKRIGEPVMCAVSDIGYIYVDMTDQSRSNLMGLFVLAQLQLSQGNTAIMTSLRDANNVNHDITPIQAIQIGVQTAAHVDKVYKKSWEIKAMDPIPEDFRDDSYWTIE